MPSGVVRALFCALIIAWMFIAFWAPLVSASGNFSNVLPLVYEGRLRIVAENREACETLLGSNITDIHEAITLDIIYRVIVNISVELTSPLSRAELELEIVSIAPESSAKYLNEEALASRLRHDIDLLDRRLLPVALEISGGGLYLNSPRATGEIISIMGFDIDIVEVKGGSPFPDPIDKSIKYWIYQYEPITRIPVYYSLVLDTSPLKGGYLYYVTVYLSNYRILMGLVDRRAWDIRVVSNETLSSISLVVLYPKELSAVNLTKVDNRSLLVEFAEPVPCYIFMGPVKIEQTVEMAIDNVTVGLSSYLYLKGYMTYYMNSPVICSRVLISFANAEAAEIAGSAPGEKGVVPMYSEPTPQELLLTGLTLLGTLVALYIVVVIISSRLGSLIGLRRALGNISRADR